MISIQEHDLNILKMYLNTKVNF